MENFLKISEIVKCLSHARTIFSTRFLLKISLMVAPKIREKSRDFSQPGTLYSHRCHGNKKGGTCSTRTGTRYRNQVGTGTTVHLLLPSTRSTVYQVPVVEGGLSQVANLFSQMEFPRFVGFKQTLAMILQEVETRLSHESISETTISLFTCPSVDSKKLIQHFDVILLLL